MNDKRHACYNQELFESLISKVRDGKNWHVVRDVKVFPVKGQNFADFVDLR
jgi:hypothetical protein